MQNLSIETYHKMVLLNRQAIKIATVATLLLVIAHSSVRVCSSNQFWDLNEFLVDKAPIGYLRNENNLAQVFFSGHLRLKPESIPAIRSSDRIYLPLNFKSVDYISGTKFNLISDSATVEFELVWNEVQTITVKVRDPAKGYGLVEFCKVEWTKIAYKNDKHYACRGPTKPIEYDCKQEQESDDSRRPAPKLVAVLVINQLEFELCHSNDCAQKHAKGKFMRESDICPEQLVDLGDSHGGYW